MPKRGRNGSGVRRCLKVCKCCRDLVKPRHFSKIPRDDFFRCVEFDNVFSAYTEAQYERCSAKKCPYRQNHESKTPPSIKRKEICNRCQHLYSGGYSEHKREHKLWCALERGEGELWAHDFFNFAPPQDCPYYFEQLVMGQEDAS